jgi:hypothetical protein
MKTQYARLAILLPVLILGACAGIPPHEALPDAARDKISSTEVVLPIKQREIYVFVPNSTAGAASGGGLIGALVDAGINDIRTSKAEAAVKPLRDALVDFDFDKILRDDVKTSLSQVSWIHGDNTRVIKEVTNDNLDKVLDASKSDAVLFVAADYHLSNDSDEFFITAGVSLFPINDALKAIKAGGKSPKSSLTNSLYHNSLAFKTKAPNATSDRDQNIATWSKSNGAAMRAALKFGAEKLAALIAADLQGQDNAAASSDAAAAVMIDGQPGDIVSRDADGAIVRFKDGTLAYVTTAAL